MWDLRFSQHWGRRYSSGFWHIVGFCLEDGKSMFLRRQAYAVPKPRTSWASCVVIHLSQCQSHGCVYFCLFMSWMGTVCHSSLCWVERRSHSQYIQYGVCMYVRMCILRSSVPEAAASAASAASWLIMLLSSYEQYWLQWLRWSLWFLIRLGWRQRFPGQNIATSFSWKCSYIWGQWGFKPTQYRSEYICFVCMKSN